MSDPKPRADTATPLARDHAPGTVMASEAGPGTVMASEAGPGTIDIVVRAVLDEFPGLDARRLRAAVERATSRIARAALDTEGYQVVDLHLARAEASAEGGERATVLRELSDTLEARGDTDRALVVRLAAFGENQSLADLDALWRLARATGRWSELPLDTMTALVDPTDDSGLRRLSEIAIAWREVGRAYHAADCLERVLAIAPGDRAAHATLADLYRMSGEHSALVDLLARRAVHAEDDAERAAVLRELATIYDVELGDDAASLEAYRDADRAEPDRPDVLDAMARLAARRGGLDDEVLATLERLAAATPDVRERARVWLRAADVARLVDYDRAQGYFERALHDDAELAPAVDGLVALMRDRGELAPAIDFLVSAAERAIPDRSRWLTDAGDFSVALGDFERAKQLYKEARRADPTNDKAGYALVELCKDTGSLVELAPILDELCRTTEEPARLRGYLIARSQIAREVGDTTGARNALARVVDLDPHDLATRRELADMLYDAGQWPRARDAFAALLEDEDRLPVDARVHLHARIARAHRELGERDGASKHAAMALALDPRHAGARAVRGELDADDPLAAAQHALEDASSAPPDEKATRFAALGDRYNELADRAMAREMYREALVHRPGDHILLTKFLGLVADDGDWSYSLDLVRRLIDTEEDAAVRAKYRHAGAMIARDELQQPEVAVELLGAAVEDDPASFAAADELERMLGSDAAVAFYYRRLEHVREREGRDGERLRLWDRLAACCLALGRVDDAAAALEVAFALAPDADKAARRGALADLSLTSTSVRDEVSIALHQELLAADHRRAASYRALRELYRRNQQLDEARACDDALTVLGFDTPERIDDLFAAAGATSRPGLGGRVHRIAQPLLDVDWLALSRPDVDLQLSSLFSLVARPFAIERVRARPLAAAPAREADLPAPVAEAVAKIGDAFAMPMPPIYVDRELAAIALIAPRTRPTAATGSGGAPGIAIAPVLVVGHGARDLDARELAFALARLLADLRRERIARMWCPRAGELAQIIELATLGAGGGEADGSKWLASALHPVELDHARAIGVRLRERGVQPLRAAIDWLAATERAGDRIGLVVAGDLASCARVLERERGAGAGDRVADLAWASVSDEVLAVRRRVEGW
jgi:tetratricopeptide (TPR) repeat protein|nr:tetratricopeptide repeat protein [Kofleriaceae bacterium]